MLGRQMEGLSDLIRLLVEAGLTIGLLAVSVRLLRAETRLGRRAWAIGAGTPLIGTLGYLLVGAPPYHPMVVAVLAVGGGLIGFLGAKRPSGSPGRAEPQPIRQKGASLVAWATVYCLAAVGAALVANADLQALATAVVATAAGVAVGTQAGLWRRGRGARGTSATVLVLGLVLGAGSLAGAPGRVVAGDLPDACAYMPSAFTVDDPTRPKILCAGYIRYDIDDSVDVAISSYPTADDARAIFERVHAELQQLIGADVPVTTFYGEMSFEAADDRGVTKIMFAKGQFTALVSFPQLDRLAEGRAWADEIARSMPGTVVAPPSPTPVATPLPDASPAPDAGPGLLELLTLGGSLPAQEFVDAMRGLLAGLIGIALAVGAGVAAGSANRTASGSDPYEAAADILGREARPGATLGTGLLPPASDVAAWNALVNWPPHPDRTVTDALKECALGEGISPVKEPDAFVACVRAKAAEARASMPSPPPPAPLTTDDVEIAGELLKPEPTEFPPIEAGNADEWKKLVDWPSGPVADQAFLNALASSNAKTPAALYRYLREAADLVRAGLRKD